MSHGLLTLGLIFILLPMKFKIFAGKFFKKVRTALAERRRRAVTLVMRKSINLTSKHTPSAMIHISLISSTSHSNSIIIMVRSHTRPLRKVTMRLFQSQILTLIQNGATVPDRQKRLFVVRTLLIIFSNKFLWLLCLFIGFIF